MFTICCTKLKVAVIMACEAVSWLLVSTCTCGPARRMNSQLQGYQKRRRSLERVSELLANDHIVIRTRKAVHSDFQGWSCKICYS